MPIEPQDDDDNYEPADLGDSDDLDEDERLRMIAEGEAQETRREILLGQIAVARSKLYEAEEAGDTAAVARLEQTIAKLTREREGA